MNPIPFLLLLVLWPALAFAQSGLDTPVPQTTGQAILAAILGLVVPLLVKLFKDWQKDKAEARLLLIEKGIQLSFWATVEAKKLWPERVPDTVAFAQAKLLELLATEKIKPTDAEIARAKIAWGALNGETKTKEDIASTAGSALVSAATAAVEAHVPSAPHP